MNDIYDQVNRRMDQRFRTKKLINMALCLLITVLGITAFIYKANYEGGTLTCFREMTVNGSVFTSLVSLGLLFANSYELLTNSEITLTPLYFLRLSSTVTEAIILIVVLIGLLPFFPDHPTFLRYDMINMHVLLPLLTITSFCLNDPPIGKLKPAHRFLGLIHIILYAVIMVSLIFVGIVPHDKIPYAFMDILNGSTAYTLMALVLISIFGYLFSWLFSELNRKLYWRRFSGVGRR